mmetsp:Transcript_12094/g.28640  ORF Transcript_12094/g.28640 Transcript_12094/m.28640 type:complete len:207 (-) Transcript_12094:51-671(-)
MNLTYTDTVANYCEMISKEDQGRRMWKKRFGHLYGADGASSGWRPVEPFEKGSSSYSDTELPPKIPSAAVSYPFLFTDSVGDLGLAGGTPKRFGGKWDCTQRQPTTDSKPPRVVKKGPHDCYCEIGFGAWSMAGKARTVNHGLKEAGLKDLWTNTPGELALVWDFKGSKDRKLKAEQQKQAKLEEQLAMLDAQVASKPTMPRPGGS